MSEDDFDFSEDFDFSDDWLPEAEATKNDRELTFLFDDPKKPPAAAVVSARQRDPRFRQLAADVRALPTRKKLYLRFLLANQMHQGRAMRAMNKAMNWKLDPSTVYRWSREDGRFRKIIEAYETLALELAGVGSPVTTLLRIDQIVEDALLPVPRIYNGLPVYVNGELQTETDRGNALKGLEQIGKANGTFRKDDEQQSRVTVVLDFSGEKEPGAQEGEIVDGVFHEIKKD